MKQIYTNCNSCCFLSTKNPEGTCLLGNWDSPGYAGKNKFEDGPDGNKEHHVVDNLCPSHRLPQWLDHKKISLAQALFSETVYDELKLSYGLVTALDDHTDPEIMIQQIFDICESTNPPNNVYVILNISDPKYSIKFLKEKLANLNRPYKIKKSLTELDTRYFIDEFAINKKIEDYYYLAVLDDSFNEDFLRGLWTAIYEDMLSVVYAGNGDTYFMVTDVHQHCSSGYSEFVKKNCGEKSCLSYEEIIKKAI